jgi:predicted chitinase
MNKYNAVTMAQAMLDSYIKNENLHIGIMCVIAKECGFELARERGYANTPNARIREIFSRTRKLSDKKLTKLKKDDLAFFNFVYNGKIGNRKGTDDGYNFRGAGWPQITGLDNFKRYCPEHIALDALPWFLEHCPEVAALTAINFFSVGLLKRAVLTIRYGRPNTQLKAIQWAANIAAGTGREKGSAVIKRATQNALKYLDEVTAIYNEVKNEEIL